MILRFTYANDFTVEAPNLPVYRILQSNCPRALETHSQKLGVGTCTKIHANKNGGLDDPTVHICVHTNDFTVEAPTLPVYRILPSKCPCENTREQEWRVGAYTETGAYSEDYDTMRYKWLLHVSITTIFWL